MIIGFPFALESLRVAGAIPEFGFLQINRLGTRVQRTLHADTKKFAVVGAGRHVIHIAAVTDLVTVAVGLDLILVIDAVEAAIQIILIFAPGDTCHDVDAITMLTPGFDARGQIGINAINNGDIGTQISGWTPRLARLERSAFEYLIGVGRKRRWSFPSKQRNASGNKRD